ncbi:DUF1624 domain-containing protein [Marinicella litoralis]|nr:heparan-alpha-glucosaminide N-acetyltransferase domain-containing protein [Marinicella litoralis]
MNTEIKRSRIQSLDILRGLVIVLMAIDHVRDMWSLEAFQPEDLSQTSPEYFFTRWITHFCAPVFVFLAGTSSFLYQVKINDTKALSRFLLIRGLWLILVEVMVINASWMLGFFWSEWGFFLQVIWAIGISMIALAGLVWLSDKMILLIALLLIFGHNALNFIVPADLGSFSWLWKMLHESGYHGLNQSGNWGVYFAYPMIPWMGVMAAGYVFGNVMTFTLERRTQWLYRLGLAAIVLFVILRYSNVYGDTAVWEPQQTMLFTFMSFLNTQKYPPSLLYVLMTMGPAFLLLILFEKKDYKWFGFLRVFGRVPFFFYVLHFIVIHLTSMVYFKLFHGEWFDLANTQNPQNWPDFYQPSLLRLYVAWAVIVVFFYYLCRWFDRYKSTHQQWWLKFL